MANETIIFHQHHTGASVQILPERDTFGGITVSVTTKHIGGSYVPPKVEIGYYSASELTLAQLDAHIAAMQIARVHAASPDAVLRIAREEWEERRRAAEEGV